MGGGGGGGRIEIKKKKRLMSVCLTGSFLVQRSYCFLFWASSVSLVLYRRSVFVQCDCTCSSERPRHVLCAL